MKTCLKVLSCFLCLLLSGGSAWPCTTFVLKGKGRVYFGRNLDWFWEDGLVLVNPRGIEKSAFLMTPGTPAKWRSKYGSITFNQFGQELPFGGMNEAGLVVENMWLDETKFAPGDARAALNLLQWIQYHLDTCRSVAEVLATDTSVRIESPPAALAGLARIHYFVCDAKGDCATIEFLNGQRIVHRGATLPCRALANSTYEESVANLRPNPASGTRNDDQSSLARFSRAAARAEAYKPSKPAEERNYAFETLDNVKQGDFTVWQIVYDLKGRNIDFRTRSNPQLRKLSLKKLDFSRGAAQCVNIQSRPAGGQWVFQDLTEASHLNYLKRFASRDSVKEKFGDISPLLQGLIGTLRTYMPVQAKR